MKPAAFLTRDPGVPPMGGANAVTTLKLWSRPESPYVLYGGC